MGKLTFKYYAIGHSYLKHGPFEGWQTEGFWGMAASAPEKDYFHRLQALLKEHYDCSIEAVAENHAEFERLNKPGVTREEYENSPSYQHIREQLRAFQPNIITVFLDANCIAKDREAMLGFYDALYGLIAAEKPENAVVLCPVCFTESTKEAAEKYGFIPVDIMAIHARKKERENNPYYAFRQYPVYEGKIEFRTHPGDEGHELIARQIFEQLKDRLPREASQGKALGQGKKAQLQGEHPPGLWDFNDESEALGLEIGGFNLRVENSILTLSAAVDTGLSVGWRGVALPCSTLRIKAAVQGDAQNLCVTVQGAEEKRFSAPLTDGKMHEYCFAVDQEISGFTIAPDGLDCCMSIDKVEVVK